MDKDIYYMNLALAEARKAYKKKEVPVGCVIVYNDKVIAKSHNTRQSTKRATNHAEMIAINKACKKLKAWMLDDTSIYVTLEPCLMCTGAIMQSRIKNVIYAASEPKSGALGSVVDISKVTGFNHTINVKKGVLEEEARTLIQSFFKELRSKNK